MIRREEASDEAESDDAGGRGHGAQDEEHDHGLDEHRIDGVDPGEDETGHGAGEEHESDGLGGLDLGDEPGAQGSRQVRRTAVLEG